MLASPQRQSGSIDQTAPGRCCQYAMEPARSERGKGGGQTLKFFTCIKWSLGFVMLSHDRQGDALTASRR